MTWIMYIIQIVVAVTLPALICIWFGIGRKIPFISDASKFHFPDVHTLLKRYTALWFINKQKKARKNRLSKYKKSGFSEFFMPSIENHKTLKDQDSCESLSFYAVDQKGNSLFIKLGRTAYRHAELSLQLILPDGSVYTLPDYPDTVVIGNMNRGWSAENLKIEVLEPLLRWRIIYNGMLFDRTQNNLKHVRLNCIFVAGGIPIQWPEDWSSQLHANALATAGWRDPQWINKIKLIEYNGFDQWGSLTGQVTIDDCVPSEFFSRGLHQNRWGKHESSQFYETIVFSGSTSQGTLFYFGACKPKKEFADLQFGHLKQANDKLCNVDWMDINISEIMKQDNKISTDYKIHFTAGENKYELIIKRRIHDVTTFYSGQPWNWKNEIHNLRIEVNGSAGMGMMQIWSPYNGPYQSKLPTTNNQHLPLLNNIPSKEYILAFDEQSCQNKNVVGGKGSSLGFLTSVKNEDFTVPHGFCVTTLAFDAQFESDKKIQESIDDIVKICSLKKKGDLQQSCEKAISVIQSTNIIEPVVAVISKALENLEKSTKTDKVTNIRYAVRSSAIGEDSEETSAAGQNSTYLGVEGVNNILKSVAMCWSSLYSYQSVEYRRQQGLPIKSSMAVCVQKMVNADLAGVLFTRHPTSGNPSSIVITSNFGLGETVVSADVEPDTVILHRGRNNELTIKSTTVGKKSHKVWINATNGLKKTVLNNSDAGKMSISEEIALRLGKIGVYIESLVGAARDMEFAVIGNEIFLLQCRPITSLDRWTDFELIHELNAGVPIDTDVITFANIGEVLPHTVTPLTMSVVVKILNASIAWKHAWNPYGYYCPVFAWRGTLNYSATTLLAVDKEIMMMNKLIDIALCGHQVITPEIHKKALERNGCLSFVGRWKALIDMARECWANETFLKKAYDIQASYDLEPNEFYSARKLYDELKKNCELLYTISYCHSHVSSVSVFYQAIAMWILIEGSSELAPHHFADLALLLGSCSDVISSKIPVALNEIAQSIKNTGKAVDFTDIRPSEGVEWLKSNCPQASKQFESFLKEHGHRCLAEFEIRSKSWSQTPDTVIDMIQSLVKSSSEGHGVSKILSTEETIALLRSPKKKSTLYFLKKLVPLCRKAVRRREETKSIFIQMTHNLKLVYRRIAALMTMEGLLPDEDLIFFLTHHEIGKLINDRNPLLIRKAIQRRRLYSQLSKLQYSEFNEGIPVPIKAAVDTKILEGNAKVQGTSACGGSVLARACVITDLSEAKLIQSGDILITRSTDTCWSPYFPLLGGVVTELGGLISHGAVVAREYGLPCIVGAVGATNVFQTGDMVLLSGDTGTLQIVDRA